MRVLVAARIFRHQRLLFHCVITQRMESFDSVLVVSMSFLRLVASNLTRRLNANGTGSAISVKKKESLFSACFDVNASNVYRENAVPRGTRERESNDGKERTAFVLSSLLRLLRRRSRGAVFISSVLYQLALLSALSFTSLPLVTIAIALNDFLTMLCVIWSLCPRDNCYWVKQGVKHSHHLSLFVVLPTHLNNFH